jgi:hypothetical protein
MPTPAPAPVVMVAPPELYDKYIYVQMMVYRHHDLSKHSSKAVKSDARGIRHESLYVKEQLSFDIANKMVYAFKDFHAHPHGSGQRTDKRMDDKHFVFFGNSGAGTLLEYKQELFFLILPRYGQDCVSGMQQSSTIQNLNINKLGLLQATLDHGKSVSGRDSKEAGISIAKRLTLGYIRVQGPNSPRSEYYNGYAKPFLTIDSDTSHPRRGVTYL